MFWIETLQKKDVNEKLVSFFTWSKLGRNLSANKIIAALILDVEEAKKVLKDIPHAQYKAMQGQMTAFIEDIGTISE